MKLAKDARNLSCAGVAVMLTLGAAVVWIIGVASGIAILLAPGHSDSIVMTTDGTPLLHRYQNNQSVFTTPEGQPISVQSSQVTHGQYMLLPRQPTMPTNSWRRRIAAVQVGSPQTVYWYLLVGVDAFGRASFIGYDAQTNQIVGYIGTNGFQSKAIQLKHQFVMPSNDEISTQMAGMLVSFDSVPILHESWDSGVHTLFLVSDGTLLAINFESRIVRKIMIEEKVLSVTRLVEPIRERPLSDGSQLLAVRTPKHIHLYSLAGDFVRSTSIPEALQSTSMVCYVVLDNRTLFSRTNVPGNKPVEIYEVASNGVTKRLPDLPQRDSFDINDFSSFTAWLIPLMLPAISFVASIYFITAPRMMVYEAEAPDYQTAMMRSLEMSLVPFVICVLLSVGLALCVYRRHQHYEKTGGIFWAVFAFFFGIPGLIGYWLHRCWPHRQACPACGSFTPTDRVECLQCSTEFPRPSAKGIEIYAD